MTDGRRNETLIFVVLFIHGYTYRVLPTQVCRLLSESNDVIRRVAQCEEEVKEKKSIKTKQYTRKRDVEVHLQSFPFCYNFAGWTCAVQLRAPLSFPVLSYGRNTDGSRMYE